MNSQEEKDLLEHFGWEYDYLARVWKAPDGYELPTDALVAAMENFGELAEQSLKQLAQVHGRKP